MSAELLARQIQESFGDCAEHAPGGLGVPRGLRVVSIRVEEDVRGAERLERFEVGAHLLERPLAGDTRVVGERRLGQPEADAGTYGWHWLAQRRGDRAEAWEADVAEPRGPDPNGVPRVAVNDGAAERGIAAAADPDRRARVALRAWCRAHLAEGRERAFVRGDIVRPRWRDCRQVVIGHGAALREREGERLELLPRPADADAQDEPSTAQAIDIRRHACGQQRMAVRDDDHGRAELDAPGAAGEPGERGERIVEWRRVARVDVGRDRHVIRW